MVPKLLTILAIMQNQWFRDPERVKKIYERNPERRTHFIRQFLFFNCLSGRRLQKAFGADLCRRIVWEEASPQIGGTSRSVYPADLDHLRRAIQAHEPDLIICFGKIAGDALREIKPPVEVLFAPHPAARNNPLADLAKLMGRIDAL